MPDLEGQGCTGCLLYVAGLLLALAVTYTGLVLLFALIERTL